MSDDIGPSLFFYMLLVAVLSVMTFFGWQRRRLRAARVPPHRSSVDAANYRRRLTSEDTQ
ncbi:MAG: hypothetical protein QNJ00_09760 [Woeseiaceae bacterium]|nr:hypothetical protein [Woeseiaceae bacterium]